MKRSIKWQMTTVLVGLVVFILIFYLLANGSLLESFYIQNKVDDFKKVYHTLVKINQSNQLNDVDSQNEMGRIADNSNISLVILDSSTVTEYTNVYDWETLVPQLLAYVLNQDQHWPREIIESTDDFEISSSTEKKNNAEYLEMWGQFENGNLFIMRSPLESIRDSVAITNQFILYVGGAAILLSCLLAWYFARRLTDPIMELTKVSQQMTELDFDAKYTSGGENEIGILGTNFNIMSEKLEKTITKLKNANFELQKDIEKKEMEEARRTEFLGNVSHELKTPIALIQGYAEGLKESVNDDSQSRDFYCDVIMDESQKMNQMVRNLMALNQLELGQDTTDLTRFNITDLIRGVLESCEIMIRQREAKVNFLQQDVVYVWGDQFKVEQVIRNYVSNALNHVANEKIIEIKIQRENDKVRITVFNTGLPIPEEDMSRIWEKFYKVDKAHTREYGGNGIGLSIVKAIMESFKQGYGVKNYDNGVEFWLELDIK